MFCSHCYATGMRPEDLFLVRCADRRWEMRCTACLGDMHGVPAAGDMAWLKDGDGDWPPEVQHTLLELRRAPVVGKKEPPVEMPNKRAFERFRMKMAVRYRLPGEVRADWRVGELIDLSKGGLGFSVDGELPLESVIPLWIESVRPDASKIDFHGEASIRRCQPDGKGGFVVGAQFVQKKNKDNRRSNRQNVLFNLWYRRDGQKTVKQGTLMDISRGGMSLVVTENITRDAVLYVCARGDSGVFRGQEILAKLRVVRSVRVYTGNYELGTEFLRTKVSPCGTGKDVKPAKIEV